MDVEKGIECMVCKPKKLCILYTGVFYHNFKHHIHEEHGYSKMHVHCVPNV